MVKIEKNIQVIKCDICGSEDNVHKQCRICKKDVCQNCLLELYKDTSSETPYHYQPFILPERHHYFDSMCKECYELFKKEVEKKVKPCG